MAGAGAVPEFTHAVPGLLRLFVLLVRTGLEIVGMATRTIRLVGWLRPGCRLRVTLVAIETADARPVIAGIAWR